MANVEINDLTLQATLNDTDELEIQETAGGTSKKTTVADLRGDEGTFTPWIGDQSLDDTEATQNVQDGEYVEAGELVFVQMDVSISAKGTLSTAIVVGGLPLQAHASKASSALSVTNVDNAVLTAGQNISAEVPDGQTYIQLYVSDTANGETALAAAQIDTTFRLTIAGHYFKN